jgi:hypothetical protein
MAHFAKLDENNIVLSVHVVNNDVITVNGVESEQVGIDFLTSLHGYPRWKQTSYNNNFRKRYAGIGYTYDPVKDIFIAPAEFPDWTLDENFDWQPPVPYPTDGKYYIWNQYDSNWIEAYDKNKEI